MVEENYRIKIIGQRDWGLGNIRKSSGRKKIKKYIPNDFLGQEGVVVKEVLMGKNKKIKIYIKNNPGNFLQRNIYSELSYLYYYIILQKNIYKGFGLDLFYSHISPKPWEYNSKISIIMYLKTKV